MANIKSSKKRAIQNPKRRLLNRRYISGSRTAVKQANSAIEAGDMNAAEEAVRHACAMLDRAAGKGVIHPGNAARRKSRLMARFNEARGLVNA
ncbi:MAG: 30S ribosomal protein S20 [Anaerolineales bacterium]|nr:30S ribosomal protein S20 [Anaerolineales bacterium]MCB9127004.1 30S ribosomal protein S20 [Ardenticatenales bacterium]MCB9172368.1 30S ribosomal protein S20 [Ardenticatenales bacterium]